MLRLPFACRLAVGVFCLSLALLRASHAVADDALATAAEMVQRSGTAGGICAIVGATAPDLALALAKQGPLVVQALCEGDDRCASLRAAIRAAGAYGTVSANVLPPGRLPYADNLVNLVIVESAPSSAGQGPGLDEVLRVLTPLGTAYFHIETAAAAGMLKSRLRSLDAKKEAKILESGGTWIAIRKPWPEQIDEWTHYLHGPDGNPVAHDTVVGPPRHYQWLGGPMVQRSHETDSSVSTLVTAAGRLFYIADQAPVSLVGQHSLPDSWWLMARDAFNGVLLWQVPIRRWGWREWRDTWFNNRPGDIPLNIQKRLVAAGDRVYATLGYRAPVSQLDARSGEILQTYAGTEGANEILYLDGTLVVSVLQDRQARIMALDAESGRQRWVTAESYRGSTVDYIKWTGKGGGVAPVELDPAVNVAADGNLVALIDGAEVVGLDYRTGQQRWRTAFPSAEEDRTAGGMQTQGNLWIGTIIVRDGVVLHASPYRLAALDAQTGRVLWAQPKRYIGHLWYEWKDVFVIGGLAWTWSDELDEGTFESGPKGKQRTLWPRSAKGYDLHTGELKKEVSTGNIFKAQHHHRCYRDKATDRYILASRRGSEYVDLHEGRHTVDNWVRGTCHVGMMPANGLQYAPPHPCQCYIEEKLNGMNVLAPQRAAASSPAGPQLVRGPAFDDRIPNSECRIPNPEDWPTFRRDALRTGSAATAIPDDAELLWRVTAGSRVSPPIVACGRVFVALVDEHHVACLDAADGRKCWEFPAGARVDSPPTYHQGRILFGSADGWVYCLRAADGQLAWRFRAAPEERLIGAFGQLESAWPVSGSVLVQNDVVYFVAGRSSHLDGGLYLYGLDAESGKLLHQTRLEGPRYTVDNIEQNFRLPEGALPDVLVGDGSKIYMRSRAFDADLQPARGKPELATKSGYLDDTYFKRMPWTMSGEYARLIVHDRQSIYYVRMFDSLKGLDPTVFFTPGDKGYLLFAKNMAGKRSTWSQRIRVRIRAMALTSARLYVAGPPDAVDADDPLGAFESRKGGLMCVIDTTSGERLAEQKLPSSVVFNGIAAAAGRLYLVEEAGTVACFGRR